MKNRNLLDSFGYAISGVIYCFKTQRNMRIHGVAALGVIILSLTSKLTRTDIIMLSFAVSMVLICEMINTAIEKSIDLFTQEYHPLAKIAKDVAAGAVLIAALNSTVIGYLVFFNKFLPATDIVMTTILKSKLHVTFITLILLVILVIFLKSKLSARNVLQGGMPSGHAAISFSLVTAAALLSENIFVSFLSFLLGVLVLQSRVESKIHSVIEVTLGALLGILATMLAYKLFVL